MNATSAKSRLGQVLALALVLTGSHAFADSQLDFFYNFTGVSGNGSVSTPVTAFDSTLGTLTGVEIEIVSPVLNGTAQGTNTGNGPENITVNLGGSVFVDTSGTGIIPGTNDATTGFNIVDNTFPPHGGTNIAVGGMTGDFTYLNTPGTVIAGNPAATITSPPDSLTGYTTTESSSFTVTVTGSNIQVTGGATSVSGTSTVGVNLAGSASVSGTIEVIYTYTPAPEPSKTAACMIGFALCVLVGRNYFKGRGLRLV
jgi:hypothetical protein